MFGPRKTAADVAVLLEEGLRTGTVAIWEPEPQESHPLPPKKTAHVWLFRIGAELALAVAFAAVFFLLPGHSEQEAGGRVAHFVTSVPGLLICVPVVLLGYHDLANALGKLISRHLGRDDR